MIAKICELRLTLRELGFEPRPGKGSHEIWVDTAAPRRRVALSGNDGDDAPRYQAKRVRRFRHGTMLSRIEEE